MATAGDVGRDDAPPLPPPPALAPFEARKAQLAQLARQRRVAWVLANWERGPRVVTKAEVVEVARAHGPTAALAPPPPPAPAHSRPPAPAVAPAPALRAAAAAADALLGRLGLRGDVAADAGAALLLAEATAAAPPPPPPPPPLPPPATGTDADVSAASDTASAAAGSVAAAPAVGAAPDDEHGDDDAPRSPLVELLCAPGAADLVEMLRAFVAEMDDLDVGAVAGAQHDVDAGFEADLASAEAAAGRGALWVARTGGVGVGDDGGRGAGGGGGGGGPSPPRRAAAAAGGPPPPRPPPSLGTRVRAFLTRAEAAVRAHPLSRPLHATPAAWAAACADLEKVAMCALHARVARCHPAAAARDAALHARLLALQPEVTWAALEVPAPPPALDAGWAVAAAWLRETDAYRAPGDQLLCVLNACRVVSTQLTFAAAAAGGSGAVGADDFLPALIHTVVAAAPPRLFSCLAYVCEFLRPAALMSEGGFYLTNVQSAVAFARSWRPPAARRSASGGDGSDGGVDVGDGSGSGDGGDSAAQHAALAAGLAAARDAAEAHAEADAARGAAAEAAAVAAAGSDDEAAGGADWSTALLLAPAAGGGGGDAAAPTPRRRAAAPTADTIAEYRAALAAALRGVADALEAR